MKSWFALQTVFNQEKNTQQALLLRGYTVYLPLTLMDKRRAKRLKHPYPDLRITEPLFPCYLFVEMDEGKDDFHPIRFTPGVNKIVQMSIKIIDGVEYPYPTPVPSDIIVLLKALEDKQGIHQTQTDYNKGDKIRITYGSFHDVIAIVEGTKEDRVFALLDILGKQQQIEFDYQQVEPI